MKIKIFFFLLLSLFRSAFATSALSINTPPSALILYDAPVPIWGSRLPHLFLGNLLGHFKQHYALLPVKDFTADEANGYDTIFYLGTNYHEDLPDSFLKFVLTTKQTIVWFKYHLWQFKTQTSDFSTRYGFQFSGLDDTGFNQIQYKETLLTKHALDHEMNVVTLTHPETVEILAYAQNETGLKIPYIVHSDNFWYISDIPFVYTSENDRYLAFADVLHDILKVKVKPQKRALIRLEDIHPHYDINLLKTFSDYLYKEHIPFAISLIPYYKDPQQHYPGLIDDISLTQSPLFVATLKEMVSKGGTLILHGYTHQHGDKPNPYLGVSGSDFEFMDVSIHPSSYKIIAMNELPEDSTEWVTHRISLAENLLNQVGLNAFYWETPHYAASSLDSQFFGQHFKATSGRVEYFDSGQHDNQFFPYLIYEDIYGQKVIPENLGCYSPTPWYSHPKRDLSDLIETARKNLVMRDAWASFYYHPYLGLEALKTLVENIRALGYEFVSIEAL